MNIFGLSIWSCKYDDNHQYSGMMRGLGVHVRSLSSSRDTIHVACKAYIGLPLFLYSSSYHAHTSSATCHKNTHGCMTSAFPDLVESICCLVSPFEM
jgi:hypothetical protein